MSQPEKSQEEKGSYKVLKSKFILDLKERTGLSGHEKESVIARVFFIASIEWGVNGLPVALCAGEERICLDETAPDKLRASIAEIDSAGKVCQPMANEIVVRPELTVYHR